jgi:hypothetical protein
LCEQNRVDVKQFRLAGAAQARRCSWLVDIQSRHSLGELVNGQPLAPFALRPVADTFRL